MKRFFAIFWALALLATTAQAQWYSKTYNLVTGWNAIWLSGDASHATVAELVAGSAITDVWRWNPNPDQTQFIQNPSTPTTSSDEWTVWNGTETKLTRMVGNSAYLIRCTSATKLAIPMRALPPAATWLLTGANLIGFPALSGGQVMSDYLSNMIAGGARGLPSGTKVYKYVGGDLGPSNPVLVSVGSERIDPDKPYWFNYSTVSDFEGPVHYELPSTAGLAFGRTLSTQTMGITNRTNSDLKLTFSVEPSNAAPLGQPLVTGPVPLVLRTFSSDTGAYTETQLPVGGSCTVNLAASSNSSVEFGLSRDGLLDTGIYASVLRVNDSSKSTDVRLPVSAQAASAAGLWVCEVNVDAVSSTASISGSATSVPQPATQSFPLYFLIHIDSTGVSRVLRQAFLGKLNSAGNALGITVQESLIQKAVVSDVRPVRYFSPTMPYATPSVTATGTAPVALTWSLVHGYDDPANPFVHAYHPDHDNLGAKYATKLAAGIESYTFTRTCSLSFTSSPPDGSTAVGWGSVIIGGNYSEAISGINRSPLYVGGTFKMRRLSEIGVITSVSP